MSSSSDPPVTTSDPPIPRSTPASIAPARATPTHGPGGSFSIVGSTRIAASPDHVLAVLTDYTKYPEWNRFVRNVTTVKPGPAEADAAVEAKLPAEMVAQGAGGEGGPYLKKGMAVTFQVHMDAADAGSSHSSQDMLVTVLEPFDGAETSAAGGRPRGWRVAWKSTAYPSFALRTERVHEIVDDGKGGAEVTNWETMYAPLATVVRYTVGKSLEKCFQIWLDDLKARAEGRASAAE